MLYFNIGRIINEHKAWGNKFIDNLAADIKLEFPNAKGYSVRNLKYMAKFAETYPDEEFVQQVAAQIPWGQNIVLLDKVNRRFYSPLVHRKNAGKRLVKKRTHSPDRKRFIRPPGACQQGFQL